MERVTALLLVLTTSTHWVRSADPKPTMDGIPRLELTNRRVAEVRSIAFSSDGSKIAVGGEGGALNVWDAKTGKELAKFLNATGRKKTFSSCVTFSPDGGFLAVGSNSCFEVYDLVEVKSIMSFDMPIPSVSFAPDGKTIAATSKTKKSQTVILIDVSSGKPRSKLEPTAIPMEVAYSPDGKSLAAVLEDNSISVWDTATNQVRYQGKTPDAKPIQRPMAVASLSFSPDSRYVVTSSSEEWKVRLWDTTKGTQIHVWPGHYFAWIEEGKSILVNGNDVFNIYDVKTGKSLVRLSVPHEDFTAFGGSPDGKMIAGGTDNGTIFLWDLSTLLKGSK